MYFQLAINSNVYFVQVESDVIFESNCCFVMLKLRRDLPRDNVLLLSLNCESYYLFKKKRINVFIDPKELPSSPFIRRELNRKVGLMAPIFYHVSLDNAKISITLLG